MVPNQQRVPRVQWPQCGPLHLHKLNKEHSTLQVIPGSPLYPSFCGVLSGKLLKNFAENQGDSAYTSFGSWFVDLSRVFKAKLFALAKEDSEVHDLWYAKGRKIKEESPDLNQREWFQRIVKAVFDEVRVNKKLSEKVCIYFASSERELVDMTAETATNTTLLR